MQCGGLRPDKKGFQYELRLCHQMHNDQSCTPPTCSLFAKYENRMCGKHLIGLLHTITIKSYPRKHRLYKRFVRVSLDLNTFFE